MEKVITFAIFVLLPILAHAAAIATAGGEDVRITLYDEPCLLTAVVNLPYRAFWTEDGGKTFEGCWGGSRILPLVVTYWSDKTVVAIPRKAFVAVLGT